MAAFLDTIRVGHHYLKLNETAEKVAQVVRIFKLSLRTLIQVLKKF